MEMSLADHAEAWWEMQGKEIPPKETAEWEEMYVKWIDFAFESFRERQIQ